MIKNMARSNYSTIQIEILFGDGIADDKVASHILYLDPHGTLQGAGGIGGLLAEIKGSSLRYPFCDGNGNITDWVDGEVIAHYEYDPFGNEMIGESPSTFGFLSKPYDSTLGLYYYGYRFYSPAMGRWLNRDPLEEEGGENVYSFVGNHSINEFDLLGLIGYRTTDGPKRILGDYGSYWWTVAWTFSEEEKAQLKAALKVGQKVWIIQKISYLNSIFSCNSGVLGKQRNSTYWEAFPISESFFGGIKSGSDTWFSASEGKGTEGSKLKLGEAGLYIGNLPSVFSKNSVSEAPTLFATYSNPSLSLSGIISRELFAIWDECCKWKTDIQVK